jgi:hypothetical protein
VSTAASCRTVAEELRGRRLAEVLYVGLWYESGPPDWDFGDLHRPEVGVQLVTTDGEPYHAIWDFRVTNFDLTLAKGPISDQWLPMRETLTKHVAGMSRNTLDGSRSSRCQSKT